MFGSSRLDENKIKQAKSALERAHDIRKFEIELFWKRAAYVATFQAFLFAALGISFSANNADPSIDTLLVIRCIICVVGVCSSLLWYFMNRGSRFWYKNWARHIDFLEDEFDGKLHKTVICEDEFRPYSVSRVNIAISVLFLVTWLVLFAVILFDVVRSCTCIISYSCWGPIVVFMVFLAFVLVCLRGCKLHTQFRDAPDSSKEGTKVADVYFVERGLPVETTKSPLNKEPTLKGIIRFLFDGKPRR